MISRSLRVPLLVEAKLWRHPSTVGPEVHPALASNDFGIFLPMAPLASAYLADTRFSKVGMWPKPWRRSPKNKNRLTSHHFLPANDDPMIQAMSSHVFTASDPNVFHMVLYQPLWWPFSNMFNPPSGIWVYPQGIPHPLHPWPGPWSRSFQVDSYPLGMWVNDWPAGHAVAEMMAIIIQAGTRKLGAHSVLGCDRLRHLLCLNT